MTTSASGQSRFRESARAVRSSARDGLTSGEPVLREERVGERIVGGERNGAGEEPFRLFRFALRRPQPRETKDGAAAVRMGCRERLKPALSLGPLAPVECLRSRPNR